MHLQIIKSLKKEKSLVTDEWKKYGKSHLVSMEWKFVKFLNWLMSQFRK